MMIKKVHSIEEMEKLGEEARKGYSIIPYNYKEFNYPVFVEKFCPDDYGDGFYRIISNFTNKDYIKYLEKVLRGHEKNIEAYKKFIEKTEEDIKNLKEKIEILKEEKE